MVRDHARHFIQVHHVESVASGVRTPDPLRDSVPLCSNCHSTAHQQDGKILTFEEIKSLIAMDAGNAWASDADRVSERRA